METASRRAIWCTRNRAVGFGAPILEFGSRQRERLQELTPSLCRIG